MIFTKIARFAAVFIFFIGLGILLWSYSFYSSIDPTMLSQASQGVRFLSNIADKGINMIIFSICLGVLTDISYSVEK